MHPWQLALSQFFAHQRRFELHARPSCIANCDVNPDKLFPVFANLRLVLENCPHVLSVGRGLSSVFGGGWRITFSFGLRLLAFLLEAELWPFVHTRFEPALLGVLAMPKTVFLLGAAPLKRLFHSFQSL